MQIVLPGARDLLPLAAARPQRYPCLLESVAVNARARFDIAFAFPQDAIALHADGCVRDAQGVALGADFLNVLDAMFAAQRTSDAGELPFAGGWVLYLGYELAAQVEPSLRLPAAPDADMPRALALRCPAAIIVDRVADKTILVAETAHSDLLASMREDQDAAHEFVSTPVPSASVEEDDAREFLDGVARIHEHLRAGDVFQVNLSRQWRVRCAQAPRAADVYAQLRRANPAPFAGLLQGEGWAIASSSPERLLELRGGIAQTRPIAGTRPRLPGDDDAARVRELIGHVKERAEHVMLIDLERNDLGRVCVPGSVEVDELMTVESCAHVHHIVSNVRGRLRADATPGAAIRAVFPGGTITGCPKVRCMQIIADIENAGRGAYTGALGYLNLNGDLDMNILIRTLTLHDDAIAFRAGAGIVADSIPEQELAETRAKARGLLRACGVDT